MMDKLTKEQRRIVGELLSGARSENFTQEILRIIESHNWTRDILSCARNKYLTTEQKNVYYSLGGGYTIDEVSEHLFEYKIERMIAEKLKHRGVSRYLYENREYLAALREGREIFEGLDIETIKREIDG